jgi:hypothetical protein
MITYYSLPFEVVILISQVSPMTWCSMTLADPRLGRYSLCGRVREDVQDRFTVKIVKKDKTKYILPNGLLHRNGDQPAVIYSDNDQLLYRNSSKCWYQYGKVHRDGDQPAFIQMFPNSSLIIRSWWYKKGKKHRDGNLPAFIAYNKLGSVCGSTWYQNDVMHRSGIQLAAINHRNGLSLIYHNGINCSEILGKISGNITYSTLPLYIILRITQYSPILWWGFVIADPRISRGYYYFQIQFQMRDRFATSITEIVDQPLGLGRGKRKVYRLPNGVIHRNIDKPAVIYECGLKKYYWYGKLTGTVNKPAVLHRGYIKKYYNNGELFNAFKPTVKIYKLTDASYDNEHYN